MTMPGDFTDEDGILDDSEEIEEGFAFYEAKDKLKRGEKLTAAEQALIAKYSGDD